MHKVRSVARKHRYFTSNEPSSGNGGDRGSILPTYNHSLSVDRPSESGGLNQNDGRVSPTDPTHGTTSNGGGADNRNITAIATHNDVEDATLESEATPAAPSNKSKTEGSGDPTLEDSGLAEGSVKKPSIGKRMTAGCGRFVTHLRDAVFSSYINVLLVFVPIGIAAEAARLSPALVFALNAVAIIPLAGLLAYATESVANQLGSNIGALLNVTFGNAVELIIFIIALAKGEITIVQASILGSILANLLLILGMAFLLGGLRYREQIYNNTVTQMSACLLTLSVASLVLPTAFHASFNQDNVADADAKILEVSRGTSVVLLLVYIIYLLFQLKSHAYMYESTPQHVIDEESHPGVLADIMNSSTSSSSSDSDSSSSGSSGSNETAGKRIRRIIKHRRRRKSSASTSTAGTHSMPSASSPSTEVHDHHPEGRSQQHSRGTSPLGVIVSGDEGDADIEDAAPRVRDFVSLDGETSKSPERKKKHRRKHRKHHKKRAVEDEEKASEKDNQYDIETTQFDRRPSSNHVGFAKDVAIADGQQSMPNRPFNMRGFSSRATNLRPGLSKMLSNSVFVTPPPQPGSPALAPRSRSAGNLRRTSSLPDRLNEQNEPAEPNITSNGTLPPYIVRRVQTRRAGVVSASEAQAQDADEDKPHMSRTAAIVMLLLSTGLVAACAEFMVDAIPDMMVDSPVSEAFIGLIILPIVGNAAEHVTAVTVAAKNKMDLAIGVAVGSSIQIALFVTPIVVLLGWIMHTDMSLYFNIFQTVSLFVTVLVVNFLCLDGRSNYLEGALLIAAYVIIALVAFFYPQENAQSAVGGGH